jgi:hypothetical protein
MNTIRFRRPAAAIVAVCAVAVLSGGCMNQPVTHDEGMRELLARPTSEEAVATYQRMLGEIVTALGPIVPTLRWEPWRTATHAGCSDDLVHLGGRTVAIPDWHAAGPVPDQVWPSALAVVEEISVRYGFDSTLVYASEPGRHEIRRDSPDGGFLEFGHRGNTNLTATTGCHLPAADHHATTSPPATS